MATFTFHIGKGYSGTRGGVPDTENVFGETLGVPDPSGFTAISIVDSAASFNVSGLSIEHEVVAVLVNISGLSTSELFCINWWRDLDRKSMYHIDLLAPAGSLYFCSWIGWTRGELVANGDYFIDIHGSGDTIWNFQQQFAITNMPDGAFEPKRVAVTGEKFLYVSSTGRKRFILGEEI